MRRRTLVLTFILFTLFHNVYCQIYFEDVIAKITNITDHNELETARRRKKKGKQYLMYLIYAAVLMKSVIFPIAFKSMAVMTGIAVLFSAMGLIVSSIVGYAKLSVKSPNTGQGPHKLPYNYWAKDDTGGKNYFVHGENYEYVSPGPQ